MLLGANLLCILYQVIFSPLLSGNDAWGLESFLFVLWNMVGATYPCRSPKLSI